MELLDIINDYVEQGGGNEVILDSFSKAWSVINDPQYKKIVCSISGGADSDVMLDLCYKVDKDKKIDYVWFDTGLEYQATKEHLAELENKYYIIINPFKAIKPIPLSCRQIGQPFISKQVSEEIARLQRHDFQWEDESFDILIQKYPQCKQALRWWCNDWGESSHFNIKRNKWLKEFMIANPPQFAISNKCCAYAKKDVAIACNRQGGYDLSIYGVRKDEGGARATAYKSCFSDTTNRGVAEYRPLLWYKDQDRKEYEEIYEITHSRCYTEYGLDRTGCCGCPFGRDFEIELQILEQHEPKLYVAACNIFKDSYEYTRRYREFYKMMNRRSKMDKVAPFKKFLETFETDEMRDYCEDMIKLSPDYTAIMPSSTSGRYHNATQCQPGGQYKHVLFACEILNDLLSLEYMQEKYPKPKQRDCFRVSMCLHDCWKKGKTDGKYTVHEHPILAAEWIRTTNPEHNIKSALKDYIANLCSKHMGQWRENSRSSVVLPKIENDEEFLIHACDVLSSRANIDMIYDDETEKAIQANLQ